jgi:enoyl-CoA hydratase
MAVRLASDDGVAVVTIDREEALNALDVETLEALREVLLVVAADGAVRVMVLTGAGEKAFAAGADIKYMSGLDVDGAQAWGALGHSVGRLLETMPKPTIAAVNGFALGGGCELALACDLRYCSSRAKLGQPEVNLGLVPGWGGTQRLVHAVGAGFAKELIFTGRLIDAEEALRIGLVQAVHDPVLDRALKTARVIAAKSPLALAAAKTLVNQELEGGHEANLSEEARAFGELFATADAHEGLTAFVEKREPRFIGQ